MEKYDALIQHHADLYTLDSDWEGTTFRRRMTVVRLKSQELVIHSPVRLKDEDYAWLDRLGRVAYILAPNAFHNSEAHFYKERYPQAQLLTSAGGEKGLSKLAKVDGVLPAAWPVALQSELECHEFQGTRWLAESVFFHRASRTLIVTDLVFHMQHAANAVERFFFRLNRCIDRFGPSNACRYNFINNVDKARESLHTILKWDFDRVIMNHGVILPSDGPTRMRRGFAEIGIL